MDAEITVTMAEEEADAVERVRQRVATGEGPFGQAVAGGEGRRFVNRERMKKEPRRGQVGHALGG
jgi:hypothetical protein